MRGAGLAYLLSVALPGAAPAAEDAAARAKAGDFDAEAEIPCAQEVGEALGTCRAEVARGPDGGAVVVATFGNGFERVLTFEGSAFLRGNPTMSGVGTDTDWRVEDGIHVIRVDDQRFEIPEALVAGE